METFRGFSCKFRRASPSVIYGSFHSLDLRSQKGQKNVEEKIFPPLLQAAEAVQRLSFAYYSPNNKAYINLQGRWSREGEKGHDSQLSD